MVSTGSKQYKVELSNTVHKANLRLSASRSFRRRIRSRRGRRRCRRHLHRHAPRRRRGRRHRALLISPGGRGVNLLVLGDAVLLAEGVPGSRRLRDKLRNVFPPCLPPGRRPSQSCQPKIYEVFGYTLYSSITPGILQRNDVLPSIVSCSAWYYTSFGHTLDHFARGWLNQLHGKKKKENKRKTRLCFLPALRKARERPYAQCDKIRQGTGVRKTSTATKTKRKNQRGRHRPDESFRPRITQKKREIPKLRQKNTVKNNNMLAVMVIGPFPPAPLIKIN